MSIIPTVNDYVVVTAYDTNDEVFSYYAGTAAEMANFQTTGYPVRDGPIIETPESVLKAVMKEGTKGLRRGAELGGVVVNGDVVLTDTRSIVALSLAAGSESEETILVESANNIYIETNSVGATGMLAGVRDHIQVCCAWHKSICDQIDAADTVEELQAIDFSVGFPDYASSAVTVPQEEK